MCYKPELASARLLFRVGQRVFFVEGDADELAVRVDGGVAVVFYVARCGGVDRVVAPAEGILAGVPDGSSLFEDNVARNDELVCKKGAWTVSYYLLPVASLPIRKQNADY